MSLDFEMKFEFDRQWSASLVREIPHSPGVYQFFNSQNTLIYVGKAKSLKRRLSQYKNASRRKRHRKMWRIMREAKTLELILCSSEYEAESLETTLIQEHRPRWNIVGAFYFLYPMMGLKVVDRQFFFCYTTTPDQGWDGFQFYGAYRSREFTRGAYLALIQLLQYIGHPLKRKEIKGCGPKNIPKFSYVYGLRQIPLEWEVLLQKFFRGESKEFLEELVLSLLENAGARNRRLEVQRGIEDLLRFWKHEALPLKQARERVDYVSFPVPQRDRDFLFLKQRYLRRSSVSAQEGLEGLGKMLKEEANHQEQTDGDEDGSDYF